MRDYLYQAGRVWVDQIVEMQTTSVDVTDQSDEELVHPIEDNAQDKDLLDYEVPVPLQYCNLLKYIGNIVNIFYHFIE